MGSLPQVAPRAGARIETGQSPAGDRIVRSPPVRGRGLKLPRCGQRVRLHMSPPVRGRGLKLQPQPPRARDQVAPRAGARIETSSLR